MQRLRFAHGAKWFLLPVHDVREHKRVLVIAGRLPEHQPRTDCVNG